MFLTNVEDIFNYIIINNNLYIKESGLDLILKHN